jgi:hypothetical protein
MRAIVIDLSPILFPDFLKFLRRSPVTARLAWIILVFSRQGISHEGCKRPIISIPSRSISPPFLSKTVLPIYTSIDIAEVRGVGSRDISVAALPSARKLGRSAGG